MIRPIISCLLIISSFNSVAQYDPAKVKKKIAQAYSLALDKAMQGAYEEAIHEMNQCIQADPDFMDAYLSIAGIMGEKKDYRSSINYYQQARKIDSNYFKEYELPYSINLAGNGQFNEALASIERFLSIPNLNEGTIKAGEFRRSCYRFAIQQKADPSTETFTPRNLGSAINSRNSEYYPSLTIDKKTLIYTRRVNNKQEDFYGSVADTTKKWNSATPLPGMINTEKNEGAPTISQDGNWLIFTACNREDGYGSCDLYISYLTNDGWSAAQNLGELVNTASWESAPSLSPDKRDLYFSSKRSDGYGGLDLYVSHLQPNGSFGIPENLGPIINTPGDESTPFIHADNQTLYFTSNKHQGYGGDDLFLTHKNDLGKWGEPLNLGYPINTIENEGSLFIASDGKNAFYASDRADGYGGLDLYTFELPEKVRPIKTSWVRGKVFDIKSGKGLPSSVELLNLQTNQLSNKVQTDETGKFLITLPFGQDYAFNVNRKNYLFFSENFSLNNKVSDSTYEMNIALQPIEKGASIILKNIFFNTNEYTILKTSYPELNKVILLLKENPRLRIEIGGHTDNQGTETYNQKLSDARANAVVQYLIAQGIPASQLQKNGYGSKYPIADNNTEAGRSNNRRTEMKVIQ